MITTYEELKNLFHLKDNRQFKYSLVNKIRLIDNGIEVCDAGLETLIEKFRNGGSLTLNEVCQKYKISPGYLLGLIRQYKISHYQLASIKGSKYLFLKSDLEKENELFLIYTKKTNYPRLEKIFFSIFENVQSLTDREKDLLRLYYFNEKTFDKISELYDYKRVRVKQIVTNGTKKVLNLIRYAISYKAVEESYQQKYYALKKEYENLLRKYPQEKLYLVDDIKLIYNKKLRDEDLSVRCLNCFEVAKVKTIGDLVKYRRIDLLKLRNFGKKTIEEVDIILGKYGLHLIDDLSS